MFYCLLFGYCPQIDGSLELQNFQNRNGLYLPTDLSGHEICDKCFIDVIEACFIMDPLERPDAHQLRRLFQKSCQQQSNQNEDGLTKCAVLGDLHAGKTYLTSRLCDVPYAERSKTERRLRKYHVFFYDALGSEERHGTINNLIMRDVNLVFFVYGDTASQEHLKTWNEEFNKIDSIPHIEYVIFNDRTLKDCRIEGPIINSQLTA